MQLNDVIPDTYGVNYIYFVNDNSQLYVFTKMYIFLKPGKFIYTRIEMTSEYQHHWSCDVTQQSILLKKFAIPIIGSHMMAYLKNIVWTPYWILIFSRFRKLSKETKINFLQWTFIDPNIFSIAIIFFLLFNFRGLLLQHLRQHIN